MSRRPNRHQRRSAWPIDERYLAFIGPGWDRYDKCHRCNAPAGSPCRALSAVDGSIVDCEVPHKIRRLTSSGERPSFCKTGLHTAVAVLTLTFNGGTRERHWCAEHVANAEIYRPLSDQASGV